MGGVGGRNEAGREGRRKGGAYQRLFAAADGLEDEGLLDEVVPVDGGGEGAA